MESIADLPEVGEGDFIGDYQVLRVLGYAPTGTSYHVTHIGQGKDFAIKAYSISPKITPSWTQRLEAQASLLSKLNSPHTDRILGSGHAGGLWYLLKDYMHDGMGESCDLYSFIQRHGGMLSEFQIYHLTCQIVTALSHGREYNDPHHQGLSHGNLKPWNILVTYWLGGGLHLAHAPFEVKLTDWQPYGLWTPPILAESVRYWREKMSSFPLPLREPMEHAHLRSLYRCYDFMAPERLEGHEKPTMQSDLYSLGVLLYWVISGRIPKGIFPPVTQYRPDLPKGWDSFIEKCLHESLEHRTASFDAFALELQTLAPSMEAFSEKTESSEPPQEKRSLTPPGMVYIPMGSFFVGSEECGQDALPQHECTTEGFYIDRTPVTVGQFEQFTKETGYVTEAEEKGEAPLLIAGEWKTLPGLCWKNPTGQRIPADFVQHPVTQVTFRDAEAYCEWRGRRLPTEQEWEYAARGGLSGVRYPWGDVISRAQANFSSEGTTAVMRYQANGYGLFDVAGNVWEWTGSWYEAYPGNHQENPHFGQNYRVIRGGAWMYDGAHCHLSCRNANDPKMPSPTVGFRTACDFKGPPPSSPYVVEATGEEGSHDLC